MLGAAILGQAEAQMQSDRPAALARLREAESLIARSSDWLTADLEHINPALPPDLRLQRRREAFERAIQLYQVWDAAAPGQGYDMKAAEWRARLESAPAPVQTNQPGP